MLTFSACFLEGGEAKGNIACNAHGHNVGKSGPNYEPITVCYIVHPLALYKHYIVILNVFWLDNSTLFITLFYAVYFLIWLSIVYKNIYLSENG